MKGKQEKHKKIKHIEKAGDTTIHVGRKNDQHHGNDIGVSDKLHGEGVEGEL